jgi:NAD+ diphosphatase
VVTLPEEALPLAGDDLDRAGLHRTDAQWWSRRLADPTTRVLVVDGDSVAVTGSPPALDWRSATALTPPARRRAIMLGSGDGGGTVVAVDLRPPPSPLDAPPPHLVHLREVGAELEAREAGIAAHAVALLNWHRRTGFCSVCGAPTELIEAGHARRCTDAADGAYHHPRTDPCVIVLVHDGDRVLLGRRVGSPPGRFSVLAGFVEPGETLEAAVRREVLEEAGVTVVAGSPCYIASQPWPFPMSLMLGFTALAQTTDARPVDGELAEVRWLTRDELSAAAGGGELILPPPVSIAHHLLRRWLAG